MTPLLVLLIKLTLGLMAAAHMGVLLAGLKGKETFAKPRGWRYGLITAPILEELIYRALPMLLVLYGWPGVGAGVAGVLNTLWVMDHREKSGLAFVYRMALAWAYSIIAFTNGSLVWPVLLHSANNAMGKLVELILSRKPQEVAVAEPADEGLAI